jgi:hypothetical protein
LTTYLPTYSTARRDHAALVRTLESPVPLDVQVGTPFLFYYCSYSLSLTSAMPLDVQVRLDRQVVDRLSVISTATPSGARR